MLQKAWSSKTVNESLVIATINCTVLDCWLFSFFSYLLNVILSFYKLSCIEILSLYWSISAFMVYDSNQKDYIQEKRNLFALLGACLGFQLPIPDCAMSKGWGGSYAQSPCTKWSEGPWRHPRGSGTRGTWGHAGHVAAGFSHNIRAEPGPPPTAVNTLAWHRCLLRGVAQRSSKKCFIER